MPPAAPFLDRQMEPGLCLIHQPSKLVSAIAFESPTSLQLCLVFSYLVSFRQVR